MKGNLSEFELNVLRTRMLPDTRQRLIQIEALKAAPARPPRTCRDPCQSIIWCQRYRPSIVNINHSPSRIVGNDCKPMRAVHFSVRVPCRYTGHQDRSSQIINRDGYQSAGRMLPGRPHIRGSDQKRHRKADQSLPGCSCTTMVSEVMTQDVIAGHPEQSLYDVWLLMKDKRFKTDSHQQSGI